MIYYSREQAEDEIAACRTVAEVERRHNPRRWAQLLQDARKWERYLSSLEEQDIDADEDGNLVDGWGRIVRRAS